MNLYGSKYTTEEIKTIVFSGDNNRKLDCNTFYECFGKLAREKQLPVNE